MPTIKYLDYDGLDHFWDKINAKKQDKLTAGSNITISGSTISATDTTYSNATTSTAGLMSAADKTKLNGIATGAEVNVQSDWSVTDSSSDAFIKNKPTIPTVNNGTLTIQKNGTNVQTFTANQSGNATANIVTDELQRKSDTRSSMKPSDANYPAKATLHFSTIGAFDTQTQSGGYADALLLNSWDNDSGGRVNALVATKQNDQKLYHYTGTYNGSSWSGKKEIAYTDAIPTKTSDLTNDSNFVTSSGTVAKANQLTTPRTIAISGGATGTATSFSGASNISIPVTDVKDAYVTWGGKGLANNVSPDDMGCIDEFGHNKLAFLPASCIGVAYSTDGGSTWTDYGLTDAQKIAMVSTTGTWVYSGGLTGATSSNVTNLKLRIRIACGTVDGTAKLYTAAKKILFDATDPGSNAKVHMRYRSIANYKAGTETWTDISTDYDIRGGSGWNSIPFGYTFGGNMSTQTSQIGEFEFVFYNTQLGTWGQKKVSIGSVRLIGNTNWTMPSELARAGHLYTMDTAQNATFPANVKVTGSLQHGNYSYTLPNKNGTVAMTSDIPSSITVDSALSSTSTNPVQNKVINTALNGKQASLSTAQLNAANSGITAAKVTTYDGYASQIANKQDTLTAGDHINITGDTIKATDYVHSEQPVATQAVTPVVTGSMISNGTITADKLASGATVQLTLSTSDIGEGSPLAANTLYGVYI